MKTDSKDTLFLKNRSINLAGRLMQLDVPRIMGILNVTPDSFYDGGNFTEPESIKRRVKEIIEGGADILDLGACSSRPGAIFPDEELEMTRLRIAAEIIRKLYPDFPLSIDTFRENVARVMAEEYGASMINDITGGDAEPGIIDLVADKKLAYVAMHMKDMPAIMQNDPQYGNVVNDIILYFAQKLLLLRSKGVKDYIVDPGFGFGKTLDHNFMLLERLEAFCVLNAPLLVGLSRKSMIYKVLGTDPVNSLNGTTALHMYALMKGADILRVHDVREAAETIKLFSKLTEIKKG